MVLLEGRHLSKSFPVEGGALRRHVSQVQALKGLSFEMSKGETLALVGGSGCGKSTLAKIVTGLLQPDSGELLWQGQPLGTFSRLDRARKIQMIFQDPYASLNPKLSIGTQLEEVLRLAEERGSKGAREQGRKTSPPRPPAPPPPRRSVELLEAVGLSSDALAHYPFQFSGGQRQRIAIARALAMNPELLVADEPLSALDVTTQAQILALFRQLISDFHLTFLFITHDLAVAYQFAKRVLVLQEGRWVEEGPISEVLRSPQHPYTRALLDAVPKIPC